MIINADEIPSKFVAADNITIAVKSEKQISRSGTSARRPLTLTRCERRDGKMFLFQLIKKRQAARSLPNVDFPNIFCSSHNEKHKTEAIRLINDVLVPYLQTVKKETALSHNRKFSYMGCLKSAINSKSNG